MISRGRTIIIAAIVVAIGAFGIVAEWVAYGPQGHTRPWSEYGWVLDLLTGLVLSGCGAVAVQRRPASLVGPLFLLASIAWFAGTLIESPRFIGSALAPSAVFLYRGFLAHIVVTFPTGRPADRTEWLAVGLGYATSVLAPLWYSSTWGLVLVVLLIVVTWRGYRRAHGWSRAARRDALTVAVLFGVTLAALTTEGLLDLGYPLDEVVTISMHLAILAAAVLLTARLVRSDQIALTDMVVEPGLPSGTLGGELARVLDDPTVRVGIWSRRVGAFLDESGRPVTHAATDGVGLRIDQDGEPLALLVHRPGTLDDPELRRGVTDAVRLAAVNVSLRDKVEEQVRELAASRRRVIVAGDVAGEALARRVRDGAMAHIDAADDDLRAAADRILGTEASTDGHGPVEDAIERSQRRLRRALEDLRAFALGLDPRPLAASGLDGGLLELARDCPVPVQVHVDAHDVPRAVATDAYLVCAEALANIAKHADASSVRVDAAIADGQLRLAVSDDGVGGAHLDGGTGLRGLADRVASLDGAFSLRSDPGSGTQLIARWPLDRDSTMAGGGASRIVGTRRNASMDPTVSPDVLPVARS